MPYLSPNSVELEKPIMFDVQQKTAIFRGQDPYSALVTADDRSVGHRPRLPFNDDLRAKTLLSVIAESSSYFPHVPCKYFDLIWRRSGGICCRRSARNRLPTGVAGMGWLRR